MIKILISPVSKEINFLLKMLVIYTFIGNRM